MQALRRIAKWVLPVAIGLPCVAVHAFADEPQASLQSVAGVAAPAAAAASADTSAAVAQPLSAAGSDATFGVAMSAEQLDAHRGGEAVFNDMKLTGTVADNTARGISTGSNSINQGSLANSSGLPTVIQNSGTNVLIQNATILNVHFGN
ncbi:MAG TPA: hypothetical protein VGL08_01900 [Paraburkholderia sp.]|jgi:hypothetical protein